MRNSIGQLIKPFLVTIVALSLDSCSPSNTVFFVSSSGNDTNSGTIEKPFASIERARDIVRDLKKTTQEDITVFLRGGDYLLKETVVFSLEDSGNPEQTITYKAYQDEIPVLSAGIPVTDWEKPSAIPKGLPKIAEDKIWVADVSRIRELKKNQGISPSSAPQMDRVAGGQKPG